MTIQDEFDCCEENQEFSIRYCITSDEFRELMIIKSQNTFQEATEIILDNYKNKLDNPKLIKMLTSIKENY